MGNAVSNRLSVVLDTQPDDNELYMLIYAARHAAYLVRLNTHSTIRYLDVSYLDADGNPVQIHTEEFDGNPDSRPQHRETA